MFDIHRKEINWGGRPLVIETGHFARQADGAVMVSYGESTVLATAVGAKKANPTVDFFPLTVNYQERTYAAGKIPGGFFKREGRPSEAETLICRLIDRPIRPLFVDGYKNETQVVATVTGYDLENQTDIPAMIGASAALTLSGLPFMGPIGAARVGYIDGEYVLNPTVDQMEESELDLVVAGTHDAVLMVESQASELSEEIMLGAVMFGHEQMQPVIKAIIELAEVAAREPMELPEKADNSDLIAKIAELAEADLRAAYGETVKQTRSTKVAEIKDRVKAELVEEGDDVQALLVGGLLKDLEKKIVRGDILKTKKRIDGRDLDTVRPIASEVNVLPRTHGSALFTRGETQALCVATLGTGDDEQFIDALGGTYKETFLLHYNFPPYSVGEVGRMGGTSRREVGHGKLAWRALKAVLPSREEFPYTLRLVSEITESNGSSSMATVCGGALALMDAGVPISRPVSGIAMGLILEGSDYAVLSDILGDEDHLGDMDFKVAGTSEGITSLQMDIKIAGITKEIMEVALNQAKGGRAHILDEMNKALSGARTEMSEHAPRIETIQINKEKIREVIGTGGKVIREICEVTGAKVDIEDDGTIKVASSDAKAIEAALKWIEGIVAEPEVGKIYEGKVVKTVDFGAFVNFLGSRDGLVHISEMAKERVGQVTDVVKEGDMVKVKVLGIDDRGKVRLSMKVVDQETGEDLSADKE
ncbi:polyribonucleotide nucleotidyltransferase [Emcibacter nanhaiensis]|uniref:Polyribonucleotide nucleotidyltransferase n=1 Tax=Emcibacter nanhaiensis TaxID=1505037 RepID=A0A501PM26_9PROT|nr:polyribonucleotide nucleotidyltransferase [Emcibacter nanhaiensis]TPD61483.1 polyribonucleotide nucleotidyltransferase [Emcibacter nanhaiensis]